MKIEVVVVSPFQQNCRILMCEATREAVVVDPGDDAGQILDRIQKLQARVKCLLGTHGHIDHVGAVLDLQEKLGVPFHLHREDSVLVERLPSQMLMLLGRPGGKAPRIDAYLEEGGEIAFGECRGKILHTPGHTPGSVSFLFGEDLFCGDLVFAGSIGRTDLWGGSFRTLQRSLREKILTLPKSTRIHSGHGPSTTVGQEWECLHGWLDPSHDEFG